MQIDIANHIEKLLFLHDALTIPSFGAFSARPTTAQADYAGGTVTPPSKTLTFNENITTDDGLLVQDVAKTNSISNEQAHQTVQEFVDGIQEMLNRREIVTLPGIGRLYKNYVHKIQFLPDAANFNAESFGLPPLQFSPIARSREVVDNSPPPVPLAEAEPVITTPVTTSPSTDIVAQVREESKYGQRTSSGVVPMLIGILLLLCAMAGYWVWKQNKDIGKIAAQPDKQEEVSGRSESGKSKAPAPPSPAPATSGVSEKNTDPAPSSPQTEEIKEAPAARQDAKSGGTGKHECILVVATLQEEVNADRLVSMLESEGYQVYFLRKRGFQVGIQFRYDQLSEVQEKIVALQKLTGEENIWIKKR
jgi:cell division septation protein DedD